MFRVKKNWFTRNFEKFRVRKNWFTRNIDVPRRSLVDARSQADSPAAEPGLPGRVADDHQPLPERVMKKLVIAALLPGSRTRS